ncbi:MULTISPECIES: hypothetical protein [Sphingobium]|jgi:hypothetical protein|uniref:hypothetical protein n=1 Tax=Sphingobium TaxID=165695 RepID=UPI0004E4382E|nr:MULTISPECIES: hypothetical protein [Sphingobium]KFD27640.1 antitoxin of toxin-antitoxin stability system [Sphingobium yanoikuyae]MDV3481501.1 antitoxin of toxin-antitoxin stability system [Sphingobium yanoikuyae]OAN56803.1 antitoxin of toxin-antitoxin stability system [Sphingobium sp. TCM1]TKV43990.1 antitoxin of toxin-antitoxin stability system [Sphingobium sp. MP9-4]WBQ19632.1 antitoxin of toxin-antitoxin stability system [Sphingobium yanoikuyae]
MPELVTTNVYRLQELSATAKDAARRWYRQDAPCDDWHEFVFDDFARICELIGVELSSHAVRLYGGGTRQAPRIWFSGFSSQGDGACFEGRYRYARSSVKAIRAHAPRDGELHRIADTLAAIQRLNFYQLGAGITHRGRYYHEYSMTIDVERSGPVESAMTDGAEEVVVEALRDLARWLYRQLEAEYAYQTADEQVDAAIIANDYSFTDDGVRFP